MCFSSVCYIPIAGIAVLAATTNAKILYGSSASSFWLPMLRIEPALPMQSMLPALPMLKIEPALPMLRIEPALPMLRIEPALPMLMTEPALPMLKMLPTTLAMLRILSRLLTSGCPARLPMPAAGAARLRFRLECFALYINLPLPVHLRILREQPSITRGFAQCRAAAC
jgi:hypothetical protein